MSRGRKVPQVPRYTSKLLAAAELAHSRGQRGLIHVEILHDAWCDLLQGRGPCNCSPEVHAGPGVQKRYDALIGLDRGQE
jgi:hypothetical protein